MRGTISCLTNYVISGIFPEVSLNFAGGAAMILKPEKLSCPPVVSVPAAAYDKQIYSCNPIQAR